MTDQRKETSDRRFLRVVLAVESQASDVASEVLWEAGSLGCSEESGPGRVTFTAYFPPGKTEVLETLHAAFRERGERILSSSSGAFDCDPDSWIESYAKHFRAFEASPQVYIHPSWAPPSRRHRVNLLLEPGNGFGTGTHESTQLVLRGLEKLAGSADSMVDFGTGSGILTLAARKLNPCLDCIAFDIDPMAVEFAARNLAANRVDGVRLFTGTSRSLAGVYDLVAANLTAEIFTAAAPEIIRLSGRHLLLSGFTLDQRQQVLHSFQSRSSFRIEEEWESNGWACWHCEQ